MILRHMLSILLLPFLVAVIVPFVFLNELASYDTHWGNDSLYVWLPRSTGIGLIMLGLGMFTWCVSLFVRIGRGTLAPWDPTRNLVVVGPYRFVRNPMISGVAVILVGEALFCGSCIVGLWACLFVLFNHVYFVFFEEPDLETRFGEPYRVYKNNVPRWIPRPLLSQSRPSH